MEKIEPKFQKLTVTFEDVDQAQAIALKKAFEYMQFLGDIGSSRMVSIFSNGDGDFRPKVTIDYPEELPELDTKMGIAIWNSKEKKCEPRINGTTEGDFMIDHDQIAWKIYH